MAKPVLKFVEPAPAQVFLDLGCGKGAKKEPDYIGVDKLKHSAVEVVCDLGRDRWPWKDASVDGVRCEYMLQSLTMGERIHCMNELYRVLKIDAQATFITPYWCAHKAYLGTDVTWPPVAEGWFYNLSKTWRDAQNNIDVSGLRCHFEAVIAYGMHPSVAERHEEYRRNALSWYREAAQDLIATLTKQAIPT